MLKGGNIVYKSASYRGRTNRSEGLQFEQLIEKACTMYRQQGLALIEKTPEPIRILGRVNEQGQFKACFIKQAQPDFKGTLLGGRAIVFDAKSTTQDKLQISVLTDEQRNLLIKHRELGAWSGVLICYRGTVNKYAMIPINAFLDAKKIYGHAYISRDEAEPYTVKMKGLFIDFLEYLIP